jgi:RNA polymerase sigma-70 factor (ECF subfamily)
MNEFSKLSDFDLVSLCIKFGSKDERPFIELFQRHTTYVNRILWRYFPSEQDVEDLTQEVFFKIYRNLAQFESRSTLKTWIFTIGGFLHIP